MCPSDIYMMPVMREPVFGPESEVFSAADSNPCSIVLRDVAEDAGIRIQVRTERSFDWKDYEQGDLIVGKSVLCRLAATRGTVAENIKVEVFHT
jgi:hypothetical protein